MICLCFVPRRMLAPPYAPSHRRARHLLDSAAAVTKTAARTARACLIKFVGRLHARVP